ncbi:MAG: hypothetical protein Edafosvirus11_2 [Edafosvirus sp.]|uniref:Uncharacterized protein n=1 Tax=Edafosvirus sp. TaxID=2487765 RepID=A0A3G4ZU04_9VIRU|nr:MAG: hypothetical protein Edafosvirus11_2 [Edafosvirus sp.]
MTKEERNALYKKIAVYGILAFFAWIFHNMLLNKMGFCDSFFKNPVMFTLFAFTVNEFTSHFSAEQVKNGYSMIAKGTTVISVIWFIYDLLVNKKISEVIEDLAWFYDLVPAVIVMMIIVKKYDVKKLLLDPTYLLLDVLHANTSIEKVSVKGKRKLLITVLVEATLWIPIALIWSLTHCFIDGMIDLKTPLGFYSTMMITIMYLNIVPFLQKSTVMTFSMKIIMIALSFYNTTFALGAFFSLYA